MHTHTLAQYQAIIKICKSIFEQKTKDYGTAWRILRLSSLTDQIMIKAQRIRFIQEKNTQRINEGIHTELIGIVNYSIMALMQITLQENKTIEITYEKLVPLYDEIIAKTIKLLDNKNHDYQDAWRTMRLTSIIDIILMKLLRIKRIEDNQGTTLVSEGVAANYQDLINYAIFALIKLNNVDE